MSTNQTWNGHFLIIRCLGHFIPCHFAHRSLDHIWFNSTVVFFHGVVLLGILGQYDKHTVIVYAKVVCIARCDFFVEWS